MYMNNISFDAVITDRNGLTVDVDCRVTEPIAGGLPASISIEIPLNSREVGLLENPCALRSVDSEIEVEIKDLWYRSIPFGAVQRRYERGLFKINHAGSLCVTWKKLIADQPKIRFLLSPVQFFKEHPNAGIIDYSSVPDKTVLLFKINLEEIGEIRFVKFWTVRRIKDNSISAEILDSYAAEINWSGKFTVDDLERKVKDILIPLSVLARQAITLHGWILDGDEGMQTKWFDPLEPNYAPEMSEQSGNLCFPSEFERSAEALVEKYLQSDEKTKEAITLLSVALAPHVKRSLAGNFSALFGALEEVVALEKCNREEKDKLKESNEYLAQMLLEKRNDIEKSEHPHAVFAVNRIEGLIVMVKTAGPSFKVRFDKFKSVYPGLNTYMDDLWPLQGTSKQPGLKQFRDSFAHGLRYKYNHQAIAVAHWHFSRFVERLIFVLLEIDVPNGIAVNSRLLLRQDWYRFHYWNNLRLTADCI